MDQSYYQYVELVVVYTIYLLSKEHNLVFLIVSLTIVIIFIYLQIYIAKHDLYIHNDSCICMDTMQ